MEIDPRALNAEDAMEEYLQEYIHQQNLALLKRSLAESQDEDQRKVILKLLTEEKAKDVPLKHRLSDNS